MIFSNFCKKNKKTCCNNIDNLQPLKGDTLVDVLKIANENEIITLGVDEHLNFYVKDIQDVSAYDIINCPNKVNELYYVVNLLDN